MGGEALTDKDYPAIKSKADAICSEKQKFERIVLTKEEVPVPWRLHWLRVA
jgi:threonyl-tRNA synthetase